MTAQPTLMTIQASHGSRTPKKQDSQDFRVATAKPAAIRAIVQNGEQIDATGEAHQPLR